MGRRKIMKVKKNKLVSIIKEELGRYLEEQNGQQIYVVLIVSNAYGVLDVLGTYTDVSEAESAIESMNITELLATIKSNAMEAPNYFLLLKSNFNSISSSGSETIKTVPITAGEDEDDDELYESRRDKRFARMQNKKWEGEKS